MTRILDADYTKVRLSCQLRRRCLHGNFLVVLHAPCIHEEALSGRSAKYQHLLWSEREGSHWARSYKLAVLDLKLGPPMLGHGVAIAHRVQITRELTRRPRVQPTDEE